MQKVFLIGQAPNRTGDPRDVLLGQLARKIETMAGISHDDYLRLFQRINLLPEYPGTFLPIGPARQSAEQVFPSLVGQRTVLLGTTVASAFGLTFRPLRWFDYRGATLAILPHPSGRNRWYNEQANRDRAGRFLRDLCAPVRT